MSALIRKIVVLVEETRTEMGRPVEPADPPRRRGGGDPEPVRLDLRRGPDGADGYRRGTRRPAHRKGGCGAGDPGRDAWRAMAKRPSSARTASSNTRPRSCIRNSGAPVRKTIGKRRRPHPVVEETGRPRRCARYPARPQGCGLRAQPFRRHGGAHQRRAACRRDHGRGCDHRQRAAAAACRRAGEAGHQRRGRAALTAASRHRSFITNGGLT